ncbi:hypothetical protein N2152v2_001654 [Parachlorella kessleri]
MSPYVQEHKKLAEAQLRVHRPQHHDPHKLNYARAAKEEMDAVAASPRPVALVGRSGVEAWDRVQETLPSEAHPEHKPGPVVVTKELPASPQQVHRPQPHDPQHSLRYSHAAQREMDEVAAHPPPVELGGWSGVGAWDRPGRKLLWETVFSKRHHPEADPCLGCGEGMLEGLPSGSHPHAEPQHRHEAVVLTKGLPQEEQQVHPPQHHNPHGLRYATAALEEMDDVAAHPPHVALVG